MEFTVEQWDGLKKHCDSRGIDFLCSPFSKYAVDLLSNIGMTRWKIGSGEVINKELLDHVRTKKCEHIYVSTGMLTSEEVNELYAYMEGYNLEWTMMHCTSMYPAPLEKLNLGRIKNYQDKYKCPIGYSDHSANINAAITSIGYGITAYEGHIVLKRTQYGPDSSSSLTVDEFKKLREFKDDYEKLKETEHKGNIDEKDININRELFSKSLCLKESQKAGTIIEETMLTLKKPGNGIRKEKIGMVVGRRLRKDWPHDRILRMDPLEQMRKGSC